MSRWIVVVAGVALLAGCAQSTAGSPQPAGGSSSDSTTSGPPISDPLDLASVAGEPCALLTQQQLDSISPGLAASPESSLWGEPDCAWRNDQVILRLAPNTTTGRTIESLLVQPGVDRSTVGPYPAGRSGLFEDRNCTLGVGLAPEQTLIVNFSRFGSQLPEHKMPCEFAESIAAMAIENIPPAS